MLTKDRLEEAGKIDVMYMKVGDVFEYFDRIVDEVFDEVGEEGKKSLVLALAAVKSDFLIECLLNHREPIDFKKWIEEQKRDNEFEKKMEEVKKVAATYTNYNASPEYVAALQTGHAFSPRLRAKELWDCMRKFCEYRDQSREYKDAEYEGRYLLFNTGDTSLRINFYSNKTIRVRVFHYNEVVYSYEFKANEYNSDVLRVYSRRITRHLGAYARTLERMTA